MNSPIDDIFTAIAEILIEILDIEKEEVTPDAYLIRDLGVESIDLMELAVSLNERFGMEVDEERIFLRSLRPVMAAAANENRDITKAIAEAFPFLTVERIEHIREEVDAGPVLKVADLVSYIYQAKTAGTADAH